MGPPKFYDTGLSERLIQASQGERSVSSVLFKAPSGESSKLSPMHTSPWKLTDRFDVASYVDVPR